jgi:hypothetical protein
VVTVSDNFNRADAGTLGAAWTALVGGWAVVSNQAECNDDDGGTGYYARYDTDVGSSDMYAEVVTNSTQTSGSSNTGPAVRMRAAANTSYQFPTNLNDSCSFWRINAGAETQIGTFTTPIAAGDTIRLEAVGRTFRFKVNGVIVNLLQDTNITDGQRGGMNGYNNVGTDVVRTDNFVAGPMTDLAWPFLVDWSAQTARSTGASMTPALPVTPAAGDLVLAEGTVRSTSDTISPPAGEGWSQIELASGNSLRTYVWGKVWGLGGQTDDTTPTFTRTGTTGAFVTCAIFRNPKHATAPWTSVASAVVASGQQSNAAAATATAPSVTHTGNDRTLVRIYSSADDNALNAPNEGILVYGGAAFDATDIAQALSTREGVVVSGSTGTATVNESVLGNDASNGVTLILAVPSGTAVTGTAVVAGAGSIAGAGRRGVNGSAVVAGGGTIVGAGRRGVNGASVVSGGGVLAGSGRVGRAGSGLVAGGGLITGAGSAGRAGAGSVAGGGAVVASGARGVAGGSTVAGAGTIAAQGLTGRTGAAVVAGGGSISAVGAPGKTGAGVVAGGGVIAATGVAQGAGTGAGTVAGGGVVTAAGARGVLGSVVVAGGGTIVGAGRRSVAGVGVVAGGGSIVAVGVGVSSDVPSQGTYDPWAGTPAYDTDAQRVYDGAGQRVYDP